MVPSTRTTTVLVVEDDPALLTFYQQVLNLEGYVVITAEDGVDALRRLETHQPSAIVLDLGLPRLSGLDVSRELAAHAEVSHIPIVVVTGDTRGLNTAHFACVLRKPVTAEALIAAVNDCVRRFRQRAYPRERRTGLRCPSCGLDIITRETRVKRGGIAPVWKCSACDSVWPERRKAS